MIKMIWYFIAARKMKVLFVCAIPNYLLHLIIETHLEPY